MTQQNSTAIDVRDINQIENIIDWCKANLAEDEWSMTPVQLFTPWYKFRFTCPKTKIQIILQHL